MNILIKNILVLVLATISFELNATVKSANELFLKEKGPDRNKKIAHQLVEGQFYFSAIPFINQYLELHNEVDSELESDIETLVIKTGSMAVLNLDESKLSRFNIPSIALVNGTRLFNKGQFAKAYEELSKIPEAHQFSIEASLIKGTIKNLDRKLIEAATHYQNCIAKAQRYENDSKGEKLKRYYTYLKESCIIRNARLKMEEKKYQEAMDSYQQIDKRSYKWPYILMDKAWAAYYMEDYNRSIGLSITYKSPLLESYFFPESEVLMALSYYNLCLWDDSMKVINHFNEVFQPKAEALKEILGKNRTSNTYFLDLYYAEPDKREKLNPFIRNLITQTRKQVKFNLDLNSLKSAKDELAQLKRLKNQTEFTIILENEIEQTINFISAHINYYIKKEIFNFLTEIHKHSYSMFNLKLELLSKKRDDLYKTDATNASENRNRGNSTNINRKDDQYFFDFNGSFWADELGDYSFGLSSQCKKEEK
jgi:tetratricopeptide (TPR) repeat protein